MLAAGAFIAYYLYQKTMAGKITATGSDPSLPAGPTRYMDPLTSAQAGGTAGGAWATLEQMSQFGPT